MNFLRKIFSGARKPRTLAVSPAEVAEALIKGIRTWPEQHGDIFKRDFEAIFSRNIDEALDEVSYFLGFSVFYLTLCSCLKGSQTLQEQVRFALWRELRNLATQKQCKPPPSGQWLREDGRIWLTTGEVPLEPRNPVANLNDRFTLYDEALNRGKDKPIGESLGFMLAGLCGTTDFVFITYAAELFLGQVRAVKNILDSVEIVIWSEAQFNAEPINLRRTVRENDVRVVRDDNPPAQPPPAQSTSGSKA